MTGRWSAARGVVLAAGVLTVVAIGAWAWPTTGADPRVGGTGPVAVSGAGGTGPVSVSDVDATIRDAAPGSALAAVGNLSVKGRAPRTGYDREQFGQRWADVDRNGCDTRNDILARDLTDVVVKAGTNGCKVLGGILTDPYTGTTRTFVSGADTSDAVQIDHVVALSDAWQKGAQNWDAVTRTAFANDPLNLLAVDGPTNTAKGDGDAATWLPPDRAYRCAYVGRQVAVKQTYGVWVTVGERTAMVDVLAECPDDPLPAGSVTVPSVVTTSAVPQPLPSAAGDCAVKGNISSSTGEKIYHLPGGENYDATVITESRGERWFCSASDAEAAGWRAARR